MSIMSAISHYKVLKQAERTGHVKAVLKEAGNVTTYYVPGNPSALEYYFGKAPQDGESCRLEVKPPTLADRVLNIASMGHFRTIARTTVDFPRESESVANSYAINVVASGAKMIEPGRSTRALCERLIAQGRINAQP